MGDRYYSRIFNRLGIRGLGQTYMWLIAIDFYNRIKYNYDRIFFISGRYKLRDSFRHEEYSEISMQGKYSLQLLDKEYNTRFFSICPSLINNFTQTLQNILIDFWNDPKNIEPLMYENIDQNLVYNKITLHIEGKLALTTEIVSD